MAQLDYRPRETATVLRKATRREAILPEAYGFLARRLRASALLLLDAAREARRRPWKSTEVRLRATQAADEARHVILRTVPTWALSPSQTTLHDGRWS